jgi:dTDP-4-dehydrorhamnose reductase
MKTNRQIVVLGSNGMLGSYLVKYFKRKNERVIPLTRKEVDVANVELGFLSKTNISLNPNDVIINCAGIIKSRVDNHNVAHTIKVNSIFPHILNQECKNLGIQPIHISTDCVYNGYSLLNSIESTPHDAEDLYGKSKSLGEVPGMTTIRTSIIGEELGQSRSLIEWVKSQKNSKVTGFKNHYWNGVTCLQLCNIIEKMIEKEFFWDGVRHIFTKKHITKYSLIKLISNVYDLNVDVLDSRKRSNFCNRVLFTEFKDTKDLLDSIPDYRAQLKELKEFNIYI